MSNLNGIHRRQTRKVRPKDEFITYTRSLVLLCLTSAFSVIKVPFYNHNLDFRITLVAITISTCFDFSPFLAKLQLARKGDCI